MFFVWTNCAEPWQPSRYAIGHPRAGFRRTFCRTPSFFVDPNGIDWTSICGKPGFDVWIDVYFRDYGFKMLNPLQESYVFLPKKIVFISGGCFCRSSLPDLRWTRGIYGGLAHFVGQHHICIKGTWEAQKLLHKVWMPSEFKIGIATEAQALVSPSKNENVWMIICSFIIMDPSISRNVHDPSMVYIPLGIFNPHAFT